jgi:hypothetical protein
VPGVARESLAAVIHEALGGWGTSASFRPASVSATL